MDRSINDGKGYSDLTNDLGWLVWGESYILESYIDMFLATNDFFYLDKFIDHANKVIQNSDIYLQRKDYKNRIRYGWSSSKYSIDNVFHIHMVHTGMITFPILLFAYTVKKSNLTYYLQYIANYIDFCEKCIREFDSQFVYDPINSQGYYFFYPDEPIKTNIFSMMPCNSVAALTRSIFLLYLLTNNLEFYSKTVSIAKFYKNLVFVEEDGSYVWGYRPLYIFNKIPEDYSHGSIEVSLVDLLFSYNIVFEENDIRLLINTFLSMRREDNISYYVNGTESKNLSINYVLKTAWWLELSKYSFEIYYFVYSYLINNKYNFLEKSGSVMLTLSKLLKYYKLWSEKL
ncbi:MAG: hypothetical protein NUV32_00645 [Exilispira sp.]|jgi:hypothetical protein|nr:hypothetical protein [Exilispira sp.]